MWLKHLRDHRFKLLLFALLLLFIIVPTLLEVGKLIDTQASHWMVLAVSALLLVTATFAVSGRQRATMVAMGLMLCSLTIEVFSAALPSNEVAILHHCLRVVFFAFIGFDPKSRT